MALAAEPLVITMLPEQAAVASVWRDMVDYVRRSYGSLSGALFAESVITSTVRAFELTY